jgi:signal transduction histidine kinase
MNFSDEAFAPRGHGDGRSFRPDRIRLARALTQPAAFADPREERSFRRKYLVSGLRFSRLALLVGAFLAASFWLSLAFAGPAGPVASARQLIRLAVVLVLGLSALVLYLQPRRALRHYTAAVGLPAAFACASIAILGLLPFDFEHQRNARLVIAMTVACWLMYGFTRLPIRTLVLTCGLASVATVAGASLHQDEYLVALGAYLFVANIMGWAMALGNERRERALFLAAARQVQLQRELLANARESAEANAAKSRLVAAVNHDLHQPLTSLSLYLALLDASGSASASPLPALPLERIRECAAAMTASLSRLSEVAARCDPRERAPASCVDLRRLLQRVESVFAAQADKRGVRLEVRVPAPGACVVMSNEARLWDVLSNLVANALKYADRRRRPWVLVRAAHAGGEARLSVRDNGIGIPPVLHARIFDAYFQVTPALPGANTGSGLGLSIVREAVSRLPGHRLDLRSRAGYGARFDVFLPVTGPTLRAPAYRAATATGRETRTGSPGARGRLR